MAELEKGTQEEKEMNQDEAAENEVENEGGETNAFDITEKFKRQQPQPQVKQKELVGVTDKKVETKRLLIFMGLCFGVAWLT